MKLFTGPLEALSEYRELKEDIRTGKLPAYVDGCVDSQKCHWMSSVAQDYPLKLIVTYSETRTTGFSTGTCCFIRPGT